MPGPLPDPKRRRTNAPTIPTTNLPAAGRKGTAPRPPSWIALGETGLAWWRWAWHTPQAAAWDSGSLVVIAHRASLEDDLAAIERVQGFDVLAALDPDTEGDLPYLLRRMASLATGRIAIMKECRELDGRLGLNPKSMSDLRWKITADEEPEQSAPPVGVADLDDRRRRLGA